MVLSFRCEKSPVLVAVLDELQLLKIRGKNNLLDADLSAPRFSLGENRRGAHSLMV